MTFLSENHIRQIILQEIQNVMASNPTTFDVIASFDKINKAFFENRLPRCKFNLKLKKGYLGYFKYSDIKGNKLINPILSVNGMYQLDSNQLDSIVGHEMIHYCLALSGVDPKCSHGAQFKQMAAQMNAQLGLNIDERVDSGAMQYGMNQENANQPSKELLAFMNSYMNSLSEHAMEMKSVMKNTQGGAAVFVNNLYIFTTALVNALRRCVAHKTLNEANVLQMPQPINDFISGYKEWSRETVRFFDNIIKYRYGYGSRGNYYNGNGGLMVNKNTTLGELLYCVFPNIQKAYTNTNQQSSNALSSMQCIANTMTNIEELKQRIDSEVQYLQNNAQAQQS